jgi:hypothetical protein
MGIEIKDGIYNYVEDEIVEVVPIEIPPTDTERIETLENALIDLASGVI